MPPIYIKTQKATNTGRERERERKKMESRFGGVLLMILIFPTLVGAVVRHYKFSVSSSLHLFLF